MKFRLLNINDLTLLFEWRNSPSVWRYYLNPREVLINEHEEWFKSALTNSNKKIYVGLIDSLPAGYIRFDLITESLTEISWCLAPQFHGKGLGRLLLESGLEINPFPSAKNVHAIIHDENIASIKIAEHVEFRLLKKTPPFSTYQMKNK